MPTIQPTLIVEGEGEYEYVKITGYMYTCELNIESLYWIQKYINIKYSVYETVAACIRGAKRFDIVEEIVATLIKEGWLVETRNPIC